MMEFVVVGIGGFIGSCARLALNKAFAAVPVLPLGTLMSNVIAGLAIGIILGLGQNSEVFSPKMKLFLTTGLLGGLSTFSTFSAETVMLFQSGRHIAAIMNILLNLGLSLLGVVIGMMSAKFILQ